MWLPIYEYISDVKLSHFNDWGKKDCLWTLYKQQLFSFKARYNVYLHIECFIGDCIDIETFEEQVYADVSIV